MAHFFINRPIFAWVIAIIISMIGIIAVCTLPIEQYPNIAPPSVSINATYTGASAQTTENSVTQIIEQNMTGLDNLLYMSSNSTSSGSSQVTLTFAAGTDPDIAQVQVQNKLQQAEAMLPDSVLNNGVTVTKSSGSIFLVLSFTSSDNSMSDTDIADYMASTLKDPISRINGLGNIQVMGSEYAMRIWLNPEKLKIYSLMPTDITNAILEQNTDVSSGSLGDLPAAHDQLLNVTVTSRTRLQTVEQFENIIIKANDSGNGAIIRLADVATVELGSSSYTSTSTFNGQPAASMGIELASGANALNVSTAVDAKLKELSRFFPKGLEYHVAYSTAPFVKISIMEVVSTLIEAIILVVIIMYLFLQNWRATLIPVITVPVVLMGTFGILSLFDFSINTLSMLAMVTAIGLLVDDAIVVVENVERLMSSEGLTPYEATCKSMKEITGALIGIALVLTAVFIPMAFFDGSTGEIYRQFSVTIASAMIISLFMALTLTPALCATILKPIKKGGETSAKGILRRFFSRFNSSIEHLINYYHRGVKRILNHKKLSGIGYIIIVGVMCLMFWCLPTSFLPEEDQGILMTQITLPPGSSQQQTETVLKEVIDYVLQQPEVASIMAVKGFSMSGNGQNVGMGFIRLKDWEERSEDAASIALRITLAMNKKFYDAQVFAFSPSPIPGLGQSSGFTLKLQDLGGAGHDALVAARKELLDLANDNPLLSSVRYDGLGDAVALNLHLNDKKAAAFNLSMSDINDTLKTALGGVYVNDFIDRGRIKPVYVQGEALSRMQPEDIGRWSVRSSSGEMVAIDVFSDIGWNDAPLSLTRFNGSASMEISGQAASGVSSGTAMSEIGNLVVQLPTGFGYEWSDLSYQEQQSGSQTPLLYTISLIFVFLCLAALYESWSIPFSVMLAVPIGIVGALLFSLVRGLNNDIYFQVGLLATMGLAAKNGILIVEFAKELEEQGKSLLSAILDAASLRLRPILMTSLAFMLGMLPLVLSSGAGSGGRQSLGTGVFGGTLTSTLLGIFFVPLFYMIVRSLFANKES